jgi:DNA-binding PadR family transcriptional regulator
MTRRPTLSLNEWAVLGLLVEEPRHGYEIAAELRPDSSLGEIWTLTRQLVYRAIERLEALDLVEPRRHEAGQGGPPRTVYGPTRRGRNALRSWLRTPVTHLRDVRSELLVKLSLSARLGVDPRPLVDAQLDSLGPRFAQLASPPEGIDDIAAVWRHHSAAAIESFLSSLRAALDRPE